MIIEFTKKNQEHCFGKEKWHNFDVGMDESAVGVKVLLRDQLISGLAGRAGCSRLDKPSIMIMITFPPWNS